MLWDEWRLRVHLVEELPGHHRHLTSDYCPGKGQVCITLLYLPDSSRSCLHGLLLLEPSVLSLMFVSPGQELFSTVHLWTIWELTPVWSPTLMAFHPATHSLRRVSQLPVRLPPDWLCVRILTRGGDLTLYILYINYIFLNALKQWSEQLSLAG